MSAAKSKAPRDRCPHLEEIRVQYCGVAPIPKLVPFSDSELSNCASNTYRYCDSYLQLAQPHSTTPPNTLFYSQNHFWLDAEESGLCHIGVDGFVADVAGTVDGVTFVSSRGTHCPALALTVHGVEWPISFPNPVMIQKINSRVRSDPARLTADPYGAALLRHGALTPLAPARKALKTGRTKPVAKAAPQAAPKAGAKAAPKPAAKVLPKAPAKVAAKASPKTSALSRRRGFCIKHETAFPRFGRRRLSRSM